MTILYYLFVIRFRKLVAKGDYLAMILIILLYFVSAILFYKNYEFLRSYVPLLFLDILVYHLQRSDLELLKMKKNYKVILFTEYFIYSFPFYVVLSLKKEFVFIIAIWMMKLLLINLSGFNLKVIRYPFNTFNIYWHISFRKYRLIYMLPLLLVLVFMAENSKNQNLLYAVFLGLCIIACTPSFEREKIEEIKYNTFSAEKYLLYQFRNSVINTAYLVSPILILLCFLQMWEKMLFIVFIFIIPLLNLMFRYIYFKNNLLQQILFIFYIASSILLFGVPLLAVPFMYKKAIKTINELKTC